MSDQDREERRRYTRIDFASDVFIEQGTNSYNVHLIDISLNGALVETPENYALNTEQPVNLELTLAGDISISMRSRLVHSSHEVLGLQCQSIDMESMTHLRRLIELNMEDPKAPERVLDELISSS